MTICKQVKENLKPEVSEIIQSTLRTKLEYGLPVCDGWRVEEVCGGKDHCRMVVERNICYPDSIIGLVHTHPRVKFLFVGDPKMTEVKRDKLSMSLTPEDLIAGDNMGLDFTCVISFPKTMKPGQKIITCARPKSVDIVMTNQLSRDLDILAAMNEVDQFVDVAENLNKHYLQRGGCREEWE